MIETARRLASQDGRGPPHQSDLKRAVSTAYYALFHAVCRICADGFIGGQGADRHESAWKRAYRSLGHGFLKKQCLRAAGMDVFPTGIRKYAAAFPLLQEKRHEADYDPSSRFRRSDVDFIISRAEAAINGLGGAELKDRRAFAAFVAFQDRKS